MSRILYLVPGSGMPANEVKRREALANSFLINPANEVFFACADDGPASVESYIESEMSVGPVLKRLIKLHGTYDAVIVGCADDPGISSIRELVNVPVVGPFESSLAVASMLGPFFGVVSILEEVNTETKVLVRRLGFAEQLAGVASIDCNVLDMMEGLIPEHAVTKVVTDACARLAETGACSFVLGCMTLAFLLIDEPATASLGLPVINPAKVAVNMAELMLSTKLKQSRKAYPRPNFGKLEKSLLPGVEILRNG